MSIINTLLNTLRDYVVVAVSPISSLVVNVIGGMHHIPSELVHKKVEQNNILNKQSRNIYITDLDDTFIDWDYANRSVFAKWKHRFISRPHHEETKLFEGAEEFVKELNRQHVHTAIMSNKQHHKLIAQAKNHSWGGVFDRLFGHDRLNAITMAKFPKVRLPGAVKYSRTAFPRHIIEKLLGEKLTIGMKPIKVVYVGDRLVQDVVTANLLDEALKKYNPESSCMSILMNTRGYSQDAINGRQPDKAPKAVVSDYKELEAVVDEYFFAEKKRETTATKPTERLESGKYKPNSWINFVQEKVNSEKLETTTVGK